MTEFIRNKLTINQYMEMKVDHVNQKLIFKGKNNWYAVLINRMVILLIFLVIGFLIPSEPKGLRILGGLFVLIPTLLFIDSILKSKHPNLQKTRIVLGSNHISYTHKRDVTQVTELFRKDIEALTISYQIEVGTTQLTFFLNHDHVPIFNFIVDTKIKPKKLFKVLGRQCQLLGLDRFTASPSRPQIGKLTFSTNHGIEYNIDVPYKDQKKKSLSQQFSQDFKNTRIGNYLLTSNTDHLYINFKHTKSEWLKTAVIFFLAVTFIAVKISSPKLNAVKVEPSIYWIIFGFGILLGIYGLLRIYSEYFELYILDFKRRKLRIRNMFLQLKEIDFSAIERVHFKGEITISQSKNRTTKSFSGSIEIDTHDDKEYPLIHIASTFYGSDEDLIKDSIYTQGMFLTRLLAHRIGVEYEWYEFSEDHE